MAITYESVQLTSFDYGLLSYLMMHNYIPLRNYGSYILILISDCMSNTHYELFLFKIPRIQYLSCTTIIHLHDEGPNLCTPLYILPKRLKLVQETLGKAIWDAPTTYLRVSGFKFGWMRGMLKSNNSHIGSQAYTTITSPKTHNWSLKRLYTKFKEV